MKAGEERFMDIIRKDVQFKIPIYQRLYEWRLEHCQTLFDDIQTLLENPEIPIHFMGSIVYIDEKGQNLVGSTRELLLIDGQQRITTFTLIFLILEEIANNQNNKEFAQKIRNTCLINPYSKLETKNKLILTKQDDELLQMLSRRDDIEDVDSNLLINYGYLKKRFESIIDKFPLEKIYDNLDRIMVVNVGLLPGQDNPQQIFESLNATGKALTDADLIRNFILMNLEHELQNKIYISYWYPMESLLKKELVPFLEFYTYMERGISTNIKDLYKEFKILTFKIGVQEDNIEEFASRLLKFAKYYHALLNANDGNSNIDNALKDLNRLGYNSHYPLLLNIYNEYKDDNISSNDITEMIRFMESFLFRRSICEIPTNSLNPIFRTMWNKIQKYKSVESSNSEFNLKNSFIKELKLGQYSKRWPNDVEFREKLVYTDLYNKRFGKLILEELEKYSSRESKTRDFNEFSVEHIMPQAAGNPKNLSEEWKDMLGPNYEDIWNNWIHKLGNLTLTCYNPALSDKSFDYKKQMKDGYSHSPLKLNLDVSEYQRWDEDSIKDRGFNLAEKAIKRWKYDNTDYGQIIDEINYWMTQPVIQNLEV